MVLRHVHLTPQLVQAVRDAVDIEAIAAEHTRLRRVGRRLSGLCPLHKEKTPSFGIDPVQGLFYCFGCGAGGDAIKLHMLLSGDDFPAAIETLARRYGIPIPSRAVGRGEREEERDLEGVLEEAEAFFRRQLAAAAGPRDYLERRRIPAELVERFGIGYAPPGWRNLLGALHPQIPLGDLEAAGLIARSERREGEPYDRFRNRLMFPIRNASGRLVGFGGRALGEDDQVKYLNTAETERFQKGRLLYGLDQAKRPIREACRALLVEGYFDLLAVVAAGFPETVASMGTSLTTDQALLLARYTDEVILGYDGDRAGEEACRRALPLLLAAGLGVRRLELPEGRDPDSLRLERGEEALAAAVTSAEDAVEQEIRRLAPPEAAREPRLQARAAQGIAELLRPIPDGILRYGYGRLAAGRLGVPVELLWRRVGVDRESLAPQGPPASGDRPREVRSLEERVLQLLLQAGPGEAGDEDPLPAPRELPPPEAFLDPACRNIYRAFHALYSSRAEAPGARAVLAALAVEGGKGQGVDLLARLLLEGPFGAKRGELLEALGQLRRRLQQQRLRELASEIGEAQRRGDAVRLERLIEEKTELSHSLHGRTPPGGAPGV
jgi:DNA primase